MEKSKLEVKIGEIQFSAEGAEEWLSAQLDKFLSQIDKVPQPTKKDGLEEKKQMQDGASVGSLASFLQSNTATSNQVRKFLVTAIWLHKKGHGKNTTGEITKCLREAQQSRLGNPADCLNQNVKKGFCEKEGKNFFVTPEGFKELST